MKIDTLEARLAVLEAESAVRRLASRYFQICDCLGPSTPFAELGDLFTADAKWVGQGRYAQAFGCYEGREAIVGMIHSYCLPEPHFAMTAHFLTAEHIVAMKNVATAEWLMLQTSTYADGRGDLRSAALELVFRRETDRWRIAKFKTRNLFSRRIDHWSDQADIPVPGMRHAGDNKQ